MNCSDNHLAYVCSSCGGLLSVYSQQQETVSSGMLYGGETSCILPYSVMFDLRAVVVSQCCCLSLIIVHNPDKAVCSCQPLSLLVDVTLRCWHLMPLTYVTPASMSFHHYSITQLDVPIITLRLSRHETDKSRDLQDMSVSGKCETRLSSICVQVRESTSDSTTAHNPCTFI